MKESYGTLSETINALKKEGYTIDFNIREEQGTSSGRHDIITR